MSEHPTMRQYLHFANQVDSRLSQLIAVGKHAKNRIAELEARIHALETQLEEWKEEEEE